MTPLYDVLTLQPSVDAKQVAHKNYKLSMSFGKSRHYKIKEIAVRHIIETGVEAGLSRESIAEIFDQLCKDKDKAIEHTLKGQVKAIENSITTEKNTPPEMIVRGSIIYSL